MQGTFITLDGIDGAGKSTQVAALAQWLRALGHEVIVTRDPGGTNLGERIRTLLLDDHGEADTRCEMFLYMASRAQLVAEVIRPALEENKIVLCDRFLLANVVYQGHAGGLDPVAIWQIGCLATQGIEPTLSFILDLPPEMALRRKHRPADRMERKGPAFLERVRAGYLSEAQDRPDRIVVVDAQRDMETVQQVIRREVSRVLAARA